MNDNKAKKGRRYAKTNCYLRHGPPAAARVCARALPRSPAYAQSQDPIKIGVIAEVQSIAGAATPGGAQIAADEINAKGGIMGRKIEIVTYDNESSSATRCAPCSAR